MCIRDSFNPAEPNIILPAGISFYTFTTLCYTIDMYHKKSEPCLLYTSDAADERSSVDLGGRRIIKKKKQNIDISKDEVLEEVTTESQQYSRTR